jgi:hypothetical protein
MRTAVLFIALSILLLTGHDAYADRRVALVIGNADYTHGAALANPVNDATAIGRMLASAGFEVDARNNLGSKDMKQAVRDFSIKTRDADVAVVFYAGHGIQVNGENYLIPTDAVLGRDIDVEDEAVSLDRVMKLIDSARRLRLIIVDACRDNPFSGAMTSRAPISRGLGRVEINNTDTLVAYAAKAGSTAIDSIGTHSPFTDALLIHLFTPGLDVRYAFGRVRDEVRASTDFKQEPFLYGSLGGASIALVPAEGQPIAAAPAPSGNEWREFETAVKRGTKEVWDIFLASHPTGFYADLARGERDKLLAGVPPVVAPALPTDMGMQPASLTVAPVPSTVVPAPPAGEAKPAPESKPAAPMAPTRKFNPASKPEADAPPRKARNRGDDEDKPRTRDTERGRGDRPAARTTEERPRRTGGTACSYGRQGVRIGRSLGLDNGSGVIAAVAAHCGG